MSKQPYHPDHSLKRTRFAWWPTRCLATPTPYTRPVGWLWLCPVVETQTFLEGWVAYADEHPGARLYSNRSVDCLHAFALMVLFAVVGLAGYQFSRILSP